MTDADIQAGLTAVFHEVFGDDSLVLRPETSAETVSGWNSIRMVSIILATEQQFGIRLRSREVDKLRNVGDLAGLVRIKTLALQG
ncbi:acyl carrier protein [Lichenicoccus roseus]|uniref:Acyl carrier protein n=1 Tax=Lichenicoccus roseus TaxID=2683649 RepID=A0A5R9IZ99_9PROT|nr:acyl carrier protein [Lichenicoccus roseus]TLU70800.1 acyl carrier protein [Lichenicoccus roseus]